MYLNGAKIMQQSKARRSVCACVFVCYLFSLYLPFPPICQRNVGKFDSFDVHCAFSRAVCESAARSATVVHVRV